MAHRIHSLPEDAPWSPDGEPGREDHHAVIRGIDRVMAVHRPVVVAHLRSIRRRHPEATPSEMIRMLERRYLATVTTGGAAVGATAVVPGITTGVTLALSGVETVGFIESTALFAQSIAEVHGIPVSDPERARVLVLTLMLGREGTDLITNLAGQVSGTSPGLTAYWGELVTSALPRAALAPLIDRLKTMFIRQFAVRGGASWVGKALPFGIGAAVGGTGNNILGRRVVRASRPAFGVPPLELPPELEPRLGSLPIEQAVAARTRRLGSAIADGMASTTRAIGATGRRVGDAIPAIGRRRTAESDTAPDPDPGPAREEDPPSRSDAGADPDTPRGEVAPGDAFGAGAAPFAVDPNTARDIAET